MSLDLARAALRDPLTGLASHALLVDRLDHALVRAARKNAAVAMLLVDLDDFRAVNDGLGPDAGDALLVAAADRLVNLLRAADTIARVGGDRFGVLLEDADEPGSRIAATRVLAALAEPVGLADRLVPVSACVGVAVGPPDQSADELLRDADLALHAAKRLGPGRVAFYEPEMRSTALTRLDLKTDLRHALARDELRLVYQPIVATSDERTVAVEALLRWDHPERGPVSPAEFIPLAEESGSIVAIGRWVLSEACRQAAAWSDITVSVNVSPRQLQQPAFVDDVAAALSDSGLPADKLVLELTEGLLVADLDAAERTLVALKAVGVSIAIDDFGTGFASLTYLQRFPVDVVKIDKSFIDTVAGDGAHLLDGLLALARSMQVTAVAEGVEGVAEHDALRDLGCKLAQGYHYARPVPASELPGLAAPAEPQAA